MEASIGLSKLLGAHLVNQKHEQVNLSDVVNGKKYVGLYFSASWCPPCRMFTPLLKQFYDKYGAEKGLELVFVSSDKEEGSFKEYFSHMSWYALPFADRDRKNKLARRYKVEGIPSLVILDADGKTISPNARERLMGDQEGKNFPWAPKPLWAQLGDTVVNHKDEETTLESLKENDVVGIYFSASWCGPCRSFTPVLIELYKKLKADGKKFEVIFASNDNNEMSFKQYYAHMPWLAFPFGDDRITELGEAFGVEGIPTLVLIDAKNGQIITDDGRAAIASDPEGNQFPWLPKPVQELSPMSTSLLNDPCLMLLQKGAADATQNVEVIKQVGESLSAKWKADAPDEPAPLNFVYTTANEHEIGERVRGLLAIGDKSPVLFIMDLASGVKYTHQGEINADSVRDFVTKFVNGELKPEAIQPSNH